MPFSPPQSVASSSGPVSPLTIKKLVLDGRSKSEGALFRMYLKVSVCIDNIQPGALLPLFPENSIRMLSSEVHPLDDRFSPYYFSPDDNPLIEKGVKSLQLPSMISRTYSSLFYVGDPDTSRRHKGIDVARCSAQVLVSAYTITLVLPKEFPPPKQFSIADNSEGDEGLRHSQHPRSARKSVFNRNHLNYVVACEMSLPFFTMPPRGPFLISIPVPRCLDNQLRMRIAIPADAITRRARHSGDSTSSGDDMTGWDFLTDPPVTRRVDRSGVRNGDEDHPSDHTSVTPGVEVIQGAFQSTDCLHIRWAPPLPRRSRPENGMWRVNMQTSTAVMKCQVLARNETTLKMGISYEAKCSELWHPGVATIVGLDVVLDAKRRTILWPDEEHLKGWQVTVKEDAFVGIHKDVPQSVTRHSSLESAFSSTFLPTLNNDSMLVPRGSASLLSAPLPSNNPFDHSFENSSPNGSPRHEKVVAVTGTPLAKDSLRTSKESPPNAPVTLKINILKLLQSTKNEISFTIRGVVLIKLDSEIPEDFISLPRFNVPGIHTQGVKTWVSISMHMSGDKDIYVDDEHPSEHGRRRLTPGKEVQCEEETILIVSQSRSLPSGSRKSRPSPNNLSPNDSSSPSRKASRTSRISRNSPLSMRSPALTAHLDEPASQMPSATPAIPNLLKTPVLTHVKVSVTPLKNSLTLDGYSHSVKVTLPVYSLESDMMRFDLATPKMPNSNKPVCPKVDLLYAMYSGRPMSASIHKVADSELEPTASITTNHIVSSQVFGDIQYSISFDTSGIQTDSGFVDCVYLVDYPETEVHGNKKNVAKGKGELDALLPCFNIPVLRYEVLIDSVADSYSLKSTTLTPESFSKFSQYQVPAGFYPSLRISLLPNSSHRTRYFKTLHYILVYTVSILFITQLIWVKRELHDMRTSVHAILYGLISSGNGHPFMEGFYSENQRNMGREYSSQYGIYPENPMVIVSTVTSTLTVTQTSHTLAPSMENHSHNDDDAVPIIRLSEAHTVFRPPPPLPTPTSQETSNNDERALYALSLPSFTFSFSDEAKTIVKKFKEFMYFLRKVWNFPLDPD